MSKKTLKFHTSSGDAAKYRTKVLRQQKGLDPLTLTEIKNPTLDHCHETGHCREVLQREVNSWEGRVRNSFFRYLMGVVPDKTAWPDVLRRLATYWEEDYKKNPLHYTELPKSVKRFQNKSADIQIKLLKKYAKHEPTSSELRNKNTRGKLARELMKSGAMPLLLKGHKTK